MLKSSCSIFIVDFHPDIYEMVQKIIFELVMVGVNVLMEILWLSHDIYH